MTDTVLSYPPRREPSPSAPICPVDLDSVQAGWVWPVPHTLFQLFADRLHSWFVERANDPAYPSTADICAIGSKLALELTNILYAQVLSRECSKRGIPLTYGPKSVLFRGLAEKGCPQGTVFVLAQSRALPATPRLGRTVDKVLRSIQHQIRRQISPSQSRLLWSFLPNDLCEEYMHEQRLPTRRIGISEVFTGRVSDTPLVSEALIQNLSDSLYTHWTAVYQETGALMNPDLEAYVRRLITTEFKVIARDYDTAMQRVPNTTKPHLYTGCIGGYHRRVLATAVLRKGGEVTSFEHGGYTWHPFSNPVVRPFYSFQNLARVTRYGVYTSHQPASFQPQHVHTFATNSSHFRNLRLRARRDVLPKAITRVMLVGSAYLGEKILMDYPPDVPRWDLESRILESVSHAGLDILYKPHPGLRSPVLRHGRLAPKRDQSFETLMSEADAFIFTSSTTSAFAPALCSNRPIVLIDAESRQWEESEAMIRARCTLIPVHTDASHHFSFDMTALLAALRRVPQEPDDTYLHRFLISDPLGSRAS